ncbi:MAG: alpha-2-macroglobulin family protein, partial [Mucilaginibacter sp.]
IPAGCSYENKDQPWQNEVHREYFKDRVSIFCRKLKQGTYAFTVNLMPHYSGVYNLNPAKAEMMYFPVFYGREGMKKVVVGE